MIVDVIQYMRPDGRKVPRQAEISDECQIKYDEIIECGGRLTAEQLMTGEVSQTIETNDFDFDIIITNGADFDENKKALEDMVMRFDKSKFDEYKREYEKEN
uniref:Uncharacterized protein n=1 Tax=viral metagenome TaxID=1070528 RepID=A0A6M3KGV8_9ZZZZ